MQAAAGSLDPNALDHVNNSLYAVMLEAKRSELARVMTWPGGVTIKTRVSHIGKRSARLSQHALLGDTKTVRANAVIAMMSTETRRAIPFTDAWRAALAPWTIPASGPRAAPDRSKSAAV